MPDLEAIISRVYDPVTQSLRISGNGGGGGDAGPWLNIQRNNVEIVPLANNIDFSTDFTVTNSPSGDGNIGIGTTIARQSAIDALMQADIELDTSGFTGNLDPGTILNGQALADYLDSADLTGGVIDDSGFILNLFGSGVTSTQEFADFFDTFVFPGTGTVVSVNTILPDISGDITLTAFDVDAINLDQLGALNGVATLDAFGILDLAQWPQFVTDINGYNGGSVNLLASDILADDTGWTGNLLGVTADVASALQAFNDFTPTASADGHEIRDDGGAFTFRTGLHFDDLFVISDDLGNDETDVTLDLTNLGAALGTGGAVAPFDATYLTTTSNGTLSNEVVVGATPGGELGGTWGSPTVDATHSGSSHASIQAAAEATAAAALATVTALDLLVGTSTGVLSGEIVVGATPGGELGGTWASPTVDATHSGSSHATVQAAAEATAAAALTAHEADLSNAHSATGISFTPVGTISSTDVQAAIAEVVAEVAPASIDASGFTQNLTTSDDTLVEIAARYNDPDRFRVDYAVTKTATSSEVRSGTPLFVKIDQVLNYTEGDTGSPFFIDLGPASQVGLVPDGNWGGWVGDTTTSTRGFPIGVVTVMGAHEFQADAALGAAGCTYIDFRTTKNKAGVDSDITGVCCYMNNHVYMADDADIDWYFGRGNYIVGINNYSNLSFSSQPVFTVNNDTGGTLDGACSTGFYEGPIVMPGVTMAYRWGMYVDDAVASYLDFGQIEAGGVIERQVGIQINELVTADDYNIPINYGDPNVANAPLFRVNDDGQVVTGGIKGLNNILALAPAPSSVGILLADAANTQIGPVSGYTHTSANLKQLELKNTYTMNATTGTLANAWFGLSIDTAVIYDQNNNAFGSAGYSMTSTFSNKTTEVRNLTSIYGAFLAPTVTVDAIGCTASAITGVYSAPIITRSGSGTITVDNVIGFQSSPAILTGTTVTDRYGVRITDLGTSTGTLVNNYGVHISALTTGTTLNIGILNGASTILPGGLWGSQAASGTLKIHATTHATLGAIEFYDSTEMYPTDATLTSTRLWNVVDNTYTLNFASADAGVYQNFSPTLINQQAGAALGQVIGYQFSPTVKNLSSAAVNYGPITGFSSIPVVNVDTQTGLTLAAITEFSANLTYTRTSTGTATTTAWDQFKAAGVLSSGHTVTTRTAYKVVDITGLGTGLVDNIGVDVPALTKGTGLNIGVRSLAATNILAALYGSASSGGHLPLRSTTHATKGDIQLDNPTIELFVTNYTNTAATYTAMVADYTISMNGTAGAGVNVLWGMKWAPTVTFDQAGTAFGSVFAYSDTAVYKSPTSSTNTIGLVQSFYAAPTLQSDTATVTTGSYVAYQASPGTSRLVSGALTLSAITGFKMSPTVAANTTATAAIGFQAQLTVAASGTVTTGTGVLVSAPTNSGTLTTFVGVDIVQPTGASTNIGLRNKGTTELGTSGQTVFGTAGTLTTFAGMADGVNIATGASTGTIIANSATAQKLGFFAKTPVVQPTSANQAAVGTTAPAGGTGATAGAYDNATNRNTMISTVNSCVTLVNQLRSDLVSLGLIKGS